MLAIGRGWIYWSVTSTSWCDVVRVNIRSAGGCNTIGVYIFYRWSGQDTQRRCIEYGNTLGGNQQVEEFAPTHTSQVRDVPLGTVCTIRIKLRKTITLCDINTLSKWYKPSFLPRTFQVIQITYCKFKKTRMLDLLKANSARCFLAKLSWERKGWVWSSHFFEKSRTVLCKSLRGAVFCRISSLALATWHFSSSTRGDWEIGGEYGNSGWRKIMNWKKKKEYEKQEIFMRERNHFFWCKRIFPLLFGVMSVLNRAVCSSPHHL